MTIINEKLQIKWEVNSRRSKIKKMTKKGIILQQVIKKITFCTKQQLVTLNKKKVNLIGPLFSIYNKMFQKYGSGRPAALHIICQRPKVQWGH